MGGSREHLHLQAPCSSARDIGRAWCILAHGANTKQTHGASGVVQAHMQLRDIVAEWTHVL